MLKFPLQQKEQLSQEDALIVLFLTLSSLIIHMWMLHFPDSVCFDEVHFGNFTNFYIKNEYFFDIHPPAGKLIMYFLAKFSDYDGDINFEENYEKPYKTADYIILRITPAFFSSFCTPLIYLAMRYSSFGRAASFVPAFLIMCDTSMLTEHRFILSDGMLHFFCCLFIAYYAYFTSLRNTETDLFWKKITAGLLLGIACACKNTAWGLMLYTAFVEVFQLLQIKTDLFSLEFIDNVLNRGFPFILLVIFVHLASFAIHITVLYYHGPGDRYLPAMLKKQLIDKNYLSGELWGWRTWFPSIYLRIIALAITMHSGNMGITTFHPYMSRPINWPLLTGNYVAFWVGFEKEVDCIGNVFVYYPAFFALFLVIAGYKRQKWEIGIRFVVGWAVSYFPFYLVPRSMYLYHYLIPLIFGCMSVGAAIEIWLTPKLRGVACSIFCILGAIGFYIWSPLSYGTPHLGNEIVIWTDVWRHGDKFHRNLAASQK